MKLIYNLYQNTKACIKLNNRISSSFNCNIGVRQGDNLSSLLFSLFINDFEAFLSDFSEDYNGLKTLNNLFTNATQNAEFEAMLKLYILLYADDTIIMAETKEELQVALHAEGEYCRIWKLQVNVSKTKIIKFKKKNQRSSQMIIMIFN